MFARCPECMEYCSACLEDLRYAKGVLVMRAPCARCKPKPVEIPVTEAEQDAWDHWKYIPYVYP